MSSKRRPYPYYKVQVYDERSATWIERKRGFDTLDEARRYVGESLVGANVRVVLVDEQGYHVVGP
ncbi:MAG: hypothetical protein PVJ57_06040 [Phycisphaerae bacterium]|jgi:hypothetical protein